MNIDRKQYIPEIVIGALKMYAEGKSYASIGRYYNVSPQTIRQWVKEAKETGYYDKEG